MLDTHTVFWLATGGLGGVIVAAVTAGRAIRRADKADAKAAVTEYRIAHNLPLVIVDDEPAADDLDAKWTKFWRDNETEHRGSSLWARLHDPSDAWVRQHPGWNTDDPDVWANRLTDEDGVTAVTAAETARLNKIDAKASAGALLAADRIVKKARYAGMVDMFAQWIYARRRSVKRMVAVLDKTETWPEEWRRQLRVLLAENAVGRARDEVRSR